MPTWVLNLTNWWFTGIMGIALYWVPLIVCLCVYFYTIICEIRKDYQKRDGIYDDCIMEHYYPSVTIGSIFGYIFLSICPLVNLICFLKETAYKFIKFIFNKISWMFDIPIIPDNNKWKGLRSERYEEQNKKRKEQRGY